MGCTPSRHSSSQQGVNHNQASESSICASEQASNVVGPSVDEEVLCRLKGNLFFTETSTEQNSHDQQVHCLFIHVNVIDICLFKRFVIWCMLIIIRAIFCVYDCACSNIMIIIAICHVRTTDRSLHHWLIERKQFIYRICLRLRYYDIIPGTGSCIDPGPACRYNEIFLFKKGTE